MGVRVCNLTVYKDLTAAASCSMCVITIQVIPFPAFDHNSDHNRKIYNSAAEQRTDNLRHSAAIKKTKQRRTYAFYTILLSRSALRTKRSGVRVPSSAPPKDNAIDTMSMVLSFGFISHFSSLYFCNKLKK